MIEEASQASLGQGAASAPGTEGQASQVKCSVRGFDPEPRGGERGETDTTVLSKAWGGGGHRLASSFLVERGRFEGWRG